MKTKTLSTTDERQNLRERIAEEIGDDTLQKLEKAFTALAAAMVKRAQRRAEAVLRDVKE